VSNKVPITRADLDEFVRWILEPVGGASYYHADLIATEFNARAEHNGQRLVGEHAPSSMLGNASMVQGFLLYHALQIDFWELIAGNRR
jgi:hypothetical protein